MSQPETCQLVPLQNTDCAALQSWLSTVLDGNWSLEALLEVPAEGLQRWVLRAGEMAATSVVGFAEIRVVLDEAEVLALAIAPQWQGQGLGRVLLRQIMVQLRAQECRRCLLEVRRSNQRAQALYRGAGFVQDGVRRAYYPPRWPGAAAEDALLYSCLLVSSSPD